MDANASVKWGSLRVPVAPYIDARHLRDVRVVAGDRVKFDVPFQGEPAPEISWFKEAAEEPEPVKSSKSQSISISSSDRYVG